MRRMGISPIHPWPVRAAHWVGALSTIAMAGSGLQILGAYPFLGPRGDQASWFLLAGWRPPAILRVGGWLGGARAWHFTAAWPLVIVGLMYVGFLAKSGQWRTRLFVPRRDGPHAWATLKAYLRLGAMPRPIPAETGAYNGLQRAAYTVALGLSAIEVLSGLVMWKPVQLSWLGAWMGGYDGARAIHFFGLAAIAIFVVMHVIMVITHPRTLFEMLGGGSRVALEPEAEIKRDDERTPEVNDG